MGFDCWRRSDVKVVSAAVRAWVGRVGECGGEEAVGPVFGESPGVLKGVKTLFWC
jgi:hypothetical protein